MAAIEGEIRRVTYDPAIRQVVLYIVQSAPLPPNPDVPADRPWIEGPDSRPQVQFAFTVPAPVVVPAYAYEQVRQEDGSNLYFRWRWANATQTWVERTDIGPALPF